MTDRLAALGFYYGETYLDDPNKPTTCWLHSDGAGSSVPVSPDEQALIDLVMVFAAAPVQFPDHTHRWEERSQESLDAEYHETGALLGRWYCPGCYTETDVEPDSLLLARAAAALRSLDMLCDIEAELRDGAEWVDDEPLANVHRIRLSALTLARGYVTRALPQIIKEMAEREREPGCERCGVATDV